MKECKFCGMPLPQGIEDEICDFCKNDDGVEVLMSQEDEEEM